MSDYHKHLFHQDTIGEATAPKGEDIDADPTLAYIAKPVYYIPAATCAATASSYIGRQPTGFLSSEYLKPQATYGDVTGVLAEQSFPGISNNYFLPKANYNAVKSVYTEPGFAGIGNNYLTPKATYNSITGVAYADQGFPGITKDYLMPKATVYGAAVLLNNPNQVYANAMNLESPGHSSFLTGSTTACSTGVGASSKPANTSHSPVYSTTIFSGNPCLPSTSAYHVSAGNYCYAFQDHLSLKKDDYDVFGLKTNSLCRAVLNVQGCHKATVPVLDSWIKPTTVPTYVNNSRCLIVDSPVLSTNDYLGYSGHVGRQTKELFALNNQFSQLNEEAIWLNSEVTDAFYQSNYFPHCEDMISYLKNWSEQVKVRIQKVVAKFDRIRKYIIKLKFGAGSMRRINKKRVFRTKVNLVFKNLDDAHPNGLNYFNSINVIYQNFKYHKSWKLTFNN